MKPSRQKILSLISFFTTQTKFCGRTKLAKILFYCDWKHLKETGRTITGLQYTAYPFGPLPADLNDALREKDSDLGKFIQYKENQERCQRPISVSFLFNGKLFTPFELDIIKEAAFIFQEATADMMVRISHGIDQPWTVTKDTQGMFSIIDEKLAFSDSDAQISLDEYLDRKEEENETYRMVYGER